MQLSIFAAAVASKQARLMFTAQHTRSSNGQNLLLLTAHIPPSSPRHSSQQAELVKYNTYNKQPPGAVHLSRQSGNQTFMRPAAKRSHMRY
jgi:hypothetical protein